jgi:hypothetical protein
MARVYAPAMSKEDFARKRPKGSYTSYINYLQRQRGPRWDRAKPYQTQKIPSPSRGRLPTYESMLRRLPFDTPQQMEARANRMAQQQMMASRTLAQSDYKQQQDDAMRRMLAFQAAGRAAAGMNASLIGQVGGQYQAGADQLSAMAGGLTGMAAGATGGDVAAGNAAIANAGAAPPVTVGGPVGQAGIAGDTQAGVENYYSGTLGAQQLQNAGGYAQAGAAGQISAQNLRATQEAQAAYMSAMEQANADRAGLLKQALATRGTNAGDYLLKLQDAQRQQYALAMSMLEGRRANTEQGFQHGVTRTQLGQSQAQIDQRSKEWNASNALAQQAAARSGQQVNESRSLALGYWVDNTGAFIRGKNGNKIPVPKSAMPGAKPATAAAGSTRQQMASSATDWVYRHTTKSGATTAGKDQLVKYLKTLYPGNPAIAQAIADSVYPKKTTAASGGGGLGTRPGGG